MRLITKFDQFISYDSRNINQDVPEFLLPLLKDKAVCMQFTDSSTFIKASFHRGSSTAIVTILPGILAGIGKDKIIVSLTGAGCSIIDTDNIVPGKFVKIGFSSKTSRVLCQTLLKLYEKLGENNA